MHRTEVLIQSRGFVKERVLPHPPAGEWATRVRRPPLRPVYATSRLNVSIMQTAGAPTIATAAAAPSHLYQTLPPHTSSPDTPHLEGRCSPYFTVHPPTHTHFPPHTLPTWKAGALHARGGVHRVSKHAELGQLGADEAGHHGARVHAHPHLCGAAVMGHGNGLGAAQKGLRNGGVSVRSMVWNPMGCEKWRGV